MGDVVFKHGRVIRKERKPAMKWTTLPMSGKKFFQELENILFIYLKNEHFMYIFVSLLCYSRFYLK